MRKKSRTLQAKNQLKIILFIILIGVLSLGLVIYFVKSYFYHNVLGASSITNTIVSVNSSQTIASLPSRYLGFSFETASVCNLIGSWDTANFQQLVKNLGPQVIRIGGNTADYATWSQTGQYQCGRTNTIITPSLIDGFFTLASTLNTKVMWTVNLGSNDTTSMSQEGAYVIAKRTQFGQTGGNFLWGLGIGNEPDLYHTSGNGLRSTNYTVNNYISEWNAYRDSIRKVVNQPHFKFIAPDVADDESFLKTFIANEPTMLSRVTHHFYAIHKNNLPGSGTNQDVINALLSQSLMQQTANTIDSWRQTANTIPLAINETNSVTGGGIQGVSDTFVSTLWGIDYLFTALQHGAQQVNFHTGGLSAYTPLAFSGNGQVTPRPLYYAMLLFHTVFPAGNLVETQVNSPYNINAYSIFNNNTLRVVIINKDQTNNASVQLKVDKPFGSASSIYLTAPSLTATTGVTFGGSSIATDGTWTPKFDPLPICNTTATINVPVASVGVIVFSNPGQTTTSGCPTSTPTPVIYQAGVHNTQLPSIIPTSTNSQSTLPHATAFPAPNTPQTQQQNTFQEITPLPAVTTPTSTSFSLPKKIPSIPSIILGINNSISHTVNGFVLHLFGR